MASDSSALRSLLKDVALMGAILVPKKKLLWLLGWGQDRAGAWSDLLDMWEEIGEERDSLHGAEVSDLMFLGKGEKLKIVSVSEWASGA